MMMKFFRVHSHTSQEHTSTKQQEEMHTHAKVRHNETISSKNLFVPFQRTEISFS